ncbi:MAG TPA: prepilin-type N-terminal cleavage/methylation domain-containing protein [Kofleriaceae bacterium]|nr:prepilin-type N-terminal cleavage/methylation domain-containing protein [Kofleriaceae bacterium]
MNRTRQRGFTLIELMVALVVSSLLVGMILAIFLRLSVAYRSQQQIAGMQQVLAAARMTIENDAKQAGLGMTNGIKIASGTNVRYSPVTVTNFNNKPDQIRFIYADQSFQAAVISNGNAASTVPVDSSSGFSVGDIVIVSNPDTSTTNPGGGANITKFDSCILRVIQIPDGVSVLFDTAPPFGTPANLHCPALIANKTMIYKIVAHAYRIDPTRPDDGVLQMSVTGDLFGANDWQDLAYGFTDLQVATQFYDGDGIDTADPDTDGNRDWYSGDTQTTLTQPILDGNEYKPPLQMTITLVARTDRDVEGIPTAATPQLTVPGNDNNNSIGDRPSVPLPSATDPALMGSRIYRYTTFVVDFRNIGVGK